MNRPTVGLTVHYVSYGTPGGEYASQCRAATVTSVGAWVDEKVTPCGPPGGEHAGDRAYREVLQVWSPGALSLFVMNPTGVFLNDKVRHDPGSHHEQTDQHPAGFGYQGGTWHHICGD